MTKSKRDAERAVVRAAMRCWKFDQVPYDLWKKSRVKENINADAERDKACARLAAARRRK